MSLRYKILAAVIVITVLVLTAGLFVILLELLTTKRQFEEFDQTLRDRTIRWFVDNRDTSYNESSPVIRLPFIRDVIHVRGEEARGAIEVIKSADVLDERKEERVRDFVRRAIAESTRARPGPVVVVEGNAFAVPDKTTSPSFDSGGFYVSLDIPNFSPHEPLQKVYIVMLVGIVVIILVIYYVLSRAVIRPIERLDRAAKRVAKGDYSRPVPLAGRGDEVDTLIETFNSMMLDLRNFRQHLEERVDDARSKARATEKSLVIAQRLASTGKLASGIAHEVNNPLGGMLNAARRLLRDPPEREKQEEYLELIIEGLQRIQETVKKVLQFTPHQVAPQTVSLETVLRRALALAGHRIEGEGTEVVVDLPEDALVFGDPFELQQVFLNVLINSLDAIQEAGRPGRISIHGTAADSEIRLTVEDNGCGFDEEEVSQAFDLFFTTKEVGEGTGLGLSIAHNVIENHGGTIELRGVPGEKAVVEISLPLVDGGE